MESHSNGNIEHDILDVTSPPKKIEELGELAKLSPEKVEQLQKEL